MEITLAIYDKENKIKTAQNDHREAIFEMKKTGKELVYLACQQMKYQAGDQIRVDLSEPGKYLMVKLDETLDQTLVYVPGKEWCYEVMLDDNSREAHPQMRFASERHYLQVRLATAGEIAAYRNLAFNPHDQKEDNGAYPHASANVETRDDATFFACNAIDGIYANDYHGAYPYASWGINQQADATLTIDFGRKVELAEVAFTWRADFPHDNYWQQVTLSFSDGSSEVFQTKKTDQRQCFDFTKRVTDSVVFFNLIASEEESPFPALTQIECFGTEIR